MNSTNGEAQGAKHLTFGVVDFTMFVLTLCVSAMIGVYYGFWGNKANTLTEYLFGGKKMASIPVGFSLVASFLSAVTLMGTPTEIYLYGTLIWLQAPTLIASGLLMNYFFLPTFYELQCTSIYEYLDLRFSRNARIMASLLNTVNTVLYIPVVMYVPGLAFSQVSGLSQHYVTPVIAILCIIYTILGGMRAVIWTDFIQGIVMFVSTIVFIILGVHHVGGLDVVWQRSEAGGRIRIFEMSISPFERMTFWTVLIGGLFRWISIVAYQQAVIQKFLSLPTYSKIQSSLFIFTIGMMLFFSITFYSGLVIFATYFDCDPIKTKVVSKPDQLLPYFVTDVAANFPGLPGLFIAGILSATLSTISSYLNSIGGTVFEDFIRPFLRRSINDKDASNIIKIIILIIGTLCVAAMYIVEKLGAIYQLVGSLTSVTTGGLAGMFLFGMFYPRGNTHGALAGSICSMVIMGWIVFGNLKARTTGAIVDPVLPTSIEGCGYNYTFSNNTKSESSKDDVFPLYRISFSYYTLMGIIIVFIVGTVVSLITGPPPEEKRKPVLFTPILRKYLVPVRKKRNHRTSDQVQMNLINK